MALRCCSELGLTDIKLLYGKICHTPTCTAVKAVVNTSSEEAFKLFIFKLDTITKFCSLFLF